MIISEPKTLSCSQQGGLEVGPYQKSHLLSFSFEHLLVLPLS